MCAEPVRSSNPKRPCWSPTPPPPPPPPANATAAGHTGTNTASRTGYSDHLERQRGKPCPVKRENPLKEDVGELQVSLGGFLGRWGIVWGECKEEEEDEPDNLNLGEPTQPRGERHAHDGRHRLCQQPL